MNKILIVKIGRTLKEGKSIIDATKEAWRVNYEKAKEFDYIIGYDNMNKEIKKCFKIEGVERTVSDTSSNRVKFTLSEVDKELEKDILIQVKDVKFNIPKELIHV